MDKADTLLMPYFITDKAEGCSGWATIKADGEIVGCHQTKEAAISQMVAISLAEKIEPGGERAINAKVPAYMRAAARRGLEYVKEGKAGDGLKQQTINEARKMAAGEVSDDKWVRMAAWIARHLGDLDSPEADPNHPNYPSAGVVAHLLWGSGPSKSKARAAMEYSQGVVERIRNEERHLPNKHDQSSHASGGGVSTEIAASILERVKENGGLSVNMVTGAEPSSGYMVAKGSKVAAIVSADDFYDPVKGPQALSNYMKRNKSDLATGKNYLGVWHNKEDGKVYLDVSENIQSKSKAITAGRKRDQISIWDVANFEEIGTGGTGDIRKFGHSGTSGYVTDDGRADRRTGKKNLGQSSQAVNPKLVAAENILRHLAGKHDQSTHGKGGGKSPTALAAAEKVHSKAAKVEPQITEKMKGLAANNGGEMIGLEYRTKSLDSLTRKIQDKADEEFGGDFDKAAADIGDSVRYTMELSPNKYSAGAKNTIDELNAAGYETKVKNYWQEGNVYKGVNVTVKAPDGTKFELQFHTKASFDTKEKKNHPLYEEHRLTTTSKARKSELERAMAENWNSVEVPSDLGLLSGISVPVLQLPS